MSDTPDLRGKIMAEFREAIEDQLSWTPYEAVERHRDEVLDAVEAALPSYVRRLMDTIGILRDRLGDTTRERDEARGQVDQLTGAKRGYLWDHLSDALSDLPKGKAFGFTNLRANVVSRVHRVVAAMLADADRRCREVEASRRDWATEALGLDVRLEETRKDRQRRIEAADRLRDVLCEAFGYDTDPDEYPGDDALIGRLRALPQCSVHEDRGGTA